MKFISIIILLISIMFITTFAYDEEITLIEAGDDELFIGFFALDTQSYDIKVLSVTTPIGGGGSGGSAVQKTLDQELELIVIDDRYESGDKVFSTLFVELPYQILSQGGYFEYRLVSPDGLEYEIKTVTIEDNKDKLLLYNLPNDAKDGTWEVEGILKVNGYEDIKVSDSFNVKSYTVFIWYLLAIIILTILALMIHLKKSKNKIRYN